MAQMRKEPISMPEGQTPSRVQASSPWTDPSSVSQAPLLSLPSLSSQSDATAVSNHGSNNENACQKQQQQQLDHLCRINIDRTNAHSDSNDVRQEQRNLHHHNEAASTSPTRQSIRQHEQDLLKVLGLSKQSLSLQQQQEQKLSPERNYFNAQNSDKNNNHHQQQQQRYTVSQDSAHFVTSSAVPEMTVLIYRADLYDAGKFVEEDIYNSNNQIPNYNHNNLGHTQGNGGFLATALTSTSTSSHHHDAVMTDPAAMPMGPLHSPSPHVHAVERPAGLHDPAGTATVSSAVVVPLCAPGRYESPSALIYHAEHGTGTPPHVPKQQQQQQSLSPRKQLAQLVAVYRMPCAWATCSSATSSIAVCADTELEESFRSEANKSINNNRNNHQSSFWMHIPVMDVQTPNPHDNPALTKYWYQRRRLFSRFDQGIALDEEGWFSVTPEQIATHVAERMVQLVTAATSTMAATTSTTIVASSKQIVVLDAFCGCGGNAIAFAMQPHVATVIAVDVDRTKLLKAAHNAAIYEVPAHKLRFVECNVLFVLEHCYRDGNFVLDQPIATPEAAQALMAAMPPPVPTEFASQALYPIGGLDLLLPHIDVVFMDPPWGGMDYEVFGKHGYDLQRNMRIERPACHAPATVLSGSTALASSPAAGAETGLHDDFFDRFLTTPRTKQERKAQFNATANKDNCINGVELLRAAAAASAPPFRWVLYDVPRNCNHLGLGQAAIHAGYRGTCCLEEHYLNQRLKTSTAYFGVFDFDRVAATNTNSMPSSTQSSVGTTHADRWVQEVTTENS